MTSNYVFKPTAEEVARIIQAPSRGGGLTYLTDRRSPYAN